MAIIAMERTKVDFPARIKVDDASSVAEIRRFAVACARDDGLPEAKTADSSSGCHRTGHQPRKARPGR